MTTAKTDDATVVRAYCDAWMAGDVMAVLALYHDDLTLMWPGRHRLAGTYEGMAAALDALLELDAATNRVPVEVVDVLDGEHGAAAIVRERWCRDGASIEVLRALHYTVLEGRLRTCRVFECDQPAIDEWLSAAETAIPR